MSSLLRRVTAIPVLAFVVASSALAVTAAPALADDANTLTVVGTSDVYDSNLVQAVIKPGFEAAYPDVTLNYVSKGTGAAIAYAEGGSASAMIVHAASLENQFVDQGYSLGGYGRAIFWGDYVLLGPANDPANVLNGSTHDIVGAFEKVAAAGKRGKANFVSRGGTPGTTVQEHALWALTSGVPACQVSDVNGGGKAPSTVSGACPTTTANPSWYHTTGLTQGPNILNGDACNYSGGGCYVFTDRGTFQYLRSQGSIANLAIQVRNNADTKRGKQAALVNSFHAYAVDPSKFADNPNVQLNPAAATDFLNWITSPDAQSAIGAYLATDPDKAPFIPDASPAIATSRPSATTVDAGTPFRLSGTITNKVPTAPVLAGETVVLRFFPSVQGGAASDVATTTTDANGAFSFTYRPSATGRYAVTTPPISKVEDDSLTPVFGDRLAAGTSAQFGPVTVNGLVTIRKVTAGPGSGIITGSAGLKPVNLYTTGNLDLYAAPAGDPDAALVMKGTVVIPVSATATTTSFRYRLPVGTWRIALHYRHPNVITEGVSDVTTVTVT